MTTKPHSYLTDRVKEYAKQFKYQKIVVPEAYKAMRAFLTETIEQSMEVAEKRMIEGIKEIWKMSMAVYPEKVGAKENYKSLHKINQYCAKLLNHSKQK